MSISVVIPTRNRTEVFKKVLESLSGQSLDKEAFEVIVVGEEEQIGSFFSSGEFGFKFCYYQSLKKGAGAKRNIGIMKAHFQVILFLDDDMVAGRNLLEEHLKYHKKFDFMTGVLGKIEIPGEVEQNIFTEYLLKNDLQNTYENIDPERVDFMYFYTGNISLPRNVLLEVGAFDEDFKSYGYEDLELGYRLKKKGFIVKYNENAIGHHFYLRRFQSYLQRRFLMGKAAVIFCEKHPELKGKLSIHPRKWKEILILNRLTEEFWKNKVKMWEKEANIKKLYKFYDFFLNYYYWKGIKEGLKEEP